MQISDNAKVTMDFTGVQTHATVKTWSQPAGMGGEWLYATVTLDRNVVGGPGRPLDGGLELKFHQHDLRRLIAEMDAQLTEPVELVEDDRYVPDGAPFTVEMVKVIDLKVGDRIRDGVVLDRKPAWQTSHGKPIGVNIEFTVTEDTFPSSPERPTLRHPHYPADLMVQVFRVVETVPSPIPR